MSLRKVAEHVSPSYEAIRRLAKGQGIELQRSERKRTSNPLEEAYELLKADASLRQVAGQFGIHPESLRRLAHRDGVLLRTRGEQFTPTQRKLTPEQQREAPILVQSGGSSRQLARQRDISRSALKGRLNDKGAEYEESRRKRDTGSFCRHPSCYVLWWNRRVSLTLSSTLTLFLPPHGKLYLRLQTS